MSYIPVDLIQQNKELMESNHKIKEELNRTLMSYKALSEKYDDLANQRNGHSGNMRSPCGGSHINEVSHMGMSTNRKLLSDGELAAPEWIPEKKIFMDSDNGIESINKRKDEIMEQAHHNYPHLGGRVKSPDNNSIAVFCSVLERSKARRGLSTSPLSHRILTHVHERRESCSPYNPTYPVYEPLNSTVNQFSMTNTNYGLGSPTPKGRELSYQTCKAQYGGSNTTHDIAEPDMSHWDMRVAYEAKEAVKSAEGYKQEPKEMVCMADAVRPLPHTYRDDSKGRSLADGVPLYRPYLNGEEARILDAGNSSLECMTK